MSFKLADGTKPPEIERRVHGDSFHKTSIGQNVEVEIVECRIGGVVSLTMTCTAGWEFYGAECLMRTIAHLINEGFVVSSGTDRSTFLIKKTEISK